MGGPPSRRWRGRGMTGKVVRESALGGIVASLVVRTPLRSLSRQLAGLPRYYPSLSARPTRDAKGVGSSCLYALLPGARRRRCAARRPWSLSGLFCQPRIANRARTSAPAGHIQAVYLNIERTNFKVVSAQRSLDEARANGTSMAAGNPTTAPDLQGAEDAVAFHARNRQHERPGPPLAPVSGIGSLSAPLADERLRVVRSKRHGGHGLAGRDQ